MGRGGNDRGATLALVCCLGAGFATLLDQSVVTFAVPSLAADLGADPAQLQWLLASYSLAFGLGLVPGGRLGDAYGRRGLLVLGLALFLAGAVAGASASGVWWVVAGRVVQGLGAGLISAQVLGIVQDRFHDPARVLALAAYTVAGAAAALVGPVTAGIVVATLPPGAAWRVVLLLGAPFVAATLALAWRHVPRGVGAVGGRRADLDVVGVVVLGAVAVLVTLPVVGTGAGAARTTAVLGAVVVLAVGLVAWERRYARRGKVPLFAPTLVRQPGFVAGNVVALAWFGASVAHGTVLTLYLVQGYGLPALGAAALVLPSAVGRMGASAVASRVVGRLGSRTVPLGLGVQALGLVVVAVVAVVVPRGAGFLVAVALVEALLGVAGGIVEPPLRAVTLDFAPPGFHGVAASFLQLTQRLSATFCVALATGLLLRDGVPSRSSFAAAVLACTALSVAALVVASLPALHRARSVEPAVAEPAVAEPAVAEPTEPAVGAAR
ncbi:MFS transporter [Luteimicrobium album]|uniref:MFS transporter n=1 Tax=Luteimicrobium album TaxID=1054550 RepID=UPI0024E0FA23|nr:MFS transporter [Luteimicrobium album]